MGLNRVAPVTRKHSIQNSLALHPPPQNNFYMAFFVSSWYKDLYHKTFGAGGERGSEHDDEELADQDDERD